MTTTPASPARALPAERAAAPRAEKKKGLIARIPVPWAFAFLITLILVFGEATAGILGGYERMPLALGTAIVFEVVLSKLFRGKWPHPLSAYISGNSVAILVKPAAGLWWPIAFASAISITSKYCLKFRGKHLWNPTNFGIAALLLVAPGSTAILSHEWGNEPLSFAVVFAVGLFVAAKGRLLHLSATYAVAFLALSALRSQLPGGDAFLIEAAAITGPMYLLFMFFMVTDPRTIVRGRGRQVAVVLVIAAVDCGIRILGNNDVEWVRPLLPAPPIFALAVVGPIALLFETFFASRKPQEAAQAAPMAAAAGAR